MQHYLDAVSELLGLPRGIQASHADMPADFTDAPYLKSVWLQS